MKLSVCINSVTGSLERTEAMKLSKKLGYTAVEFWEGKDLDLDAFKTTIKNEGLTVASMGMLTPLVDPEKRPEAIANVKIAIENAKVLGAKTMIATTGQELEGVPRQKQYDSIVAGLKEAAKLVEGTDLTFVLEPLNILVNHQGYFLYSSLEAFEIVREVNSPNVKVLYDIYHQQITEGQLIKNICDNIDCIGHFHVAGNPGRCEPYTGEINYQEVFKAIDATGYKGHAGLEFWPKGDMEESLKKCLELYS